jgi:hypothetical protein
MHAWIRRPTAWLPFAVSLGALAFVLGYAAVSGSVAHQGERAPARLFQVLLLVDAVLIAVFAARWLPTMPKEATRIIAAQVLAASVPIVTVLYLESLA